LNKLEAARKGVAGAGRTRAKPIVAEGFIFRIGLQPNQETARQLRLLLLSLLKSCADPVAPKAWNLESLWIAQNLSRQRFSITQ